MKKIAIFISGTGTNMMNVVNAVQDGEISNASVDIIISSSSKAKGLLFARENGIDTDIISYKDKALDEVASELLDMISGRDIDLIVLAGFIKIIPEAFIDGFKGDIINIHPSLIPLFCGKGFYGMRVHEAVISSGMKVSGATVHYVDGGVDTGEIILQRCCQIEDTDTAETLQKKVLTIEHEILKLAVDKVLNEKKG